MPRFRILFVLTSSALVVLLNLNVWSLPRPAFQGPNSQCAPSNVTPQTDAGCAKPITGCICVVQGGLGTTTMYGYCEGCDFTFSGSLDCTWPTQGGSFSCATSLPCNGSVLCGTRCPCTGDPFYPALFTCGPCNYA